MPCSDHKGEITELTRVDRLPILAAALIPATGVATNAASIIFVLMVMVGNGALHGHIESNGVDEVDMRRLKAVALGQIAVGQLVVDNI
jgi:hypothetical protein